MYPAQFLAAPARTRCTGPASALLAAAGARVTRVADATNTASLFIGGSSKGGSERDVLGPAEARTRPPLFQIASTNTCSLY
jgi:hypothetical protein